MKHAMRLRFAAVLGFIVWDCGNAGVSVSAAEPAHNFCAPKKATNAMGASAQSALVKLRAKYGLRAMIFSGAINGKPFLTTALGTSTDGMPASTAMHFRVGQPAEGIETTMLMELVDRQKLALSDPVSRWFPAYPGATAATVDMLANSTSGFGDYVYGPANRARNIVSFADFVTAKPYHQFHTKELVARSLPPYQRAAFTPPGSKFAYSHTDFVMLGSILEQVSGRRYDLLLGDLVTSRLGLHNTQFPYYTTYLQPPVLHVYTSDRGKYEDSTYWSPSWASFSGSITSDVCDLTTWTNAFGKGTLLSSQSAATIVAPPAGAGNASNVYFAFGTIVAKQWYVWSGAFFGWSTAAAYYPPAGLSLVVTSTAGPNTAGDMFNRDALVALSQVLVPNDPIVLPPRGAPTPSTTASP